MKSVSSDFNRNFFMRKNNKLIADNSDKLTDLEQNHTMPYFVGHHI